MGNDPNLYPDLAKIVTIGAWLSNLLPVDVYFAQFTSEKGCCLLDIYPIFNIFMGFVFNC